MTKEIAVKIENEDWYIALVDECSAIISEAMETSRWALVDGYHQLGKRVLEDKANFKKAGIDDGGVTQRVALSLGKSTRTIQQAVQFATKYPNVEDIPGGKGITWHKVCNTLLIGKELDKECSHGNLRKITVCSDCGRHIK